MAILEQLEKLKLDIERFTVHTPDLDDVFVALTGNPQQERDNPS